MISAQRRRVVLPSRLKKGRSDATICASLDAAEHCRPSRRWSPGALPIRGEPTTGSNSSAGSGMAELEKLVNCGRLRRGFSLHPTPDGAIEERGDGKVTAALVSTGFAPKLRHLFTPGRDTGMKRAFEERTIPGCLKLTATCPVQAKNSHPSDVRGTCCFSWGHVRRDSLKTPVSPGRARCACGEEAGQPWPRGSVRMKSPGRQTRKCPRSLRATVIRLRGDRVDERPDW